MARRTRTVMSMTLGKRRRLGRLALVPITATVVFCATISTALAQAYPGGDSNPSGGGSTDVLGDTITRPGGGGSLASTGMSLFLLLLVAAAFLTLGVFAWRGSRSRQRSIDASA